MRLRTRSDLPAPEAPRINTPSSPNATQLACSVVRRDEGSGIFACDPVLRDSGNANDEARAEDRPFAALRRLAITVLGPDAALVGFDDLARDRQAQTRILAERPLWTISIETLEDALEIFRWNART